MNADNSSIHLSDDSGSGLEVFLLWILDDDLIWLVLEGKPSFKGKGML